MWEDRGMTSSKGNENDVKKRDPGPRQTEQEKRVSPFQPAKKRTKPIE